MISCATAGLYVLSTKPGFWQAGFDRMVRQVLKLSKTTEPAPLARSLFETWARHYMGNVNSHMRAQGWVVGQGGIVRPC